MSESGLEVQIYSNSESACPRLEKMRNRQKILEAFVLKSLKLVRH